jgi:non-ribosomal peptide synthetase component F
LQNTPFADLASQLLRVEPVEIATDTAKYDLLMTLSDRAEITGTLEYATDLFDRATADVMVADFCSVLDQIVRTPTTALNDLLAMLDAGQAERAELGRQNQRRAGLDRLRQMRRRGGVG